MLRPLRRLRARTTALLSAMAALAGCSLFVPPTTIPMQTLHPAGAPCPARASTLLVMLPGAYSRPDEFIDEGFVAAVRDRHLAVDIVIANSHMGYVKDRSLLLRLRDDVILPARAQGYAKVWLVGISLGGFAALGYGTRHGAEIDGIVAFAPYLGRDELLKEISDAGGPAAWRDRVHAHAEDDLDREVWEWAVAPPPPAIPLYLGYGRDDRFVVPDGMLATVLPADRTVTVPGGHDWPAWRALWANWLDRGLLPTRCEAPSP